MFTDIVRMLRVYLGDETMTLRRDETPPSATFHATLDGFEYVISITPTRAARINDAGEPNPPEEA